MLPVLSCMKVLARLSWSVAQCWAAKRNISSAKDIQVYRYAQRIYHDIRKWDAAFYYFGSHHLHHFTLAKMQVEIAGRRYRNGGSHGEQEQETRRFKFDRCFPAKKKSFGASWVDLRLKKPQIGIYRRSTSRARHINYPLTVIEQYRRIFGCPLEGGRNRGKCLLKHISGCRMLRFIDLRFWFTYST